MWSFVHKFFASPSKTLIFFLLVAACVRLPLFGQIPAGLNRDEAALGYNAYSILRTGKDEYGTSFPISIQSFGDQKLPGYVYTLIPFVALFGLEPWVVRLPSLLAGLGILVCVWYLTQYLQKVIQQLKPQNGKSYFTKLIPAFTLLFLALSPWSNHFSRVAYEAHLALLFFLVGLCSAISFITQKKWMKLIWSSAFWSLSMLTYHTYHIFIPVVLFSTLLVFHKEVRQHFRLKLLVTLLPLAITFGLFLLGGIYSANATKSSGISPFHSDSLWVASTEYRRVLPPGLQPLGKILANPAVEAVERVAHNLTETLPGTFLYKEGMNHGSHNPGGMPNLNLFSAPFFILGLLAVWSMRKSAGMKVLLIWFGCALVPSSLTISPAHTIRISPIWPLLEIFAGIGFWYALNLMQSRSVKKIVFSIWFVLFILAAARIFVLYFFLIPFTTKTEYSRHIQAQLLQKYTQMYPQVISSEPSSSPYIWYALLNKIDPLILQQHTVRYAPDSEKFTHVRSITQKFQPKFDSTITFQELDWPALSAKPAASEIIVIERPDQIPDAFRVHERSQFLEAAKQPWTNTTAYEVWKINPILTK